MNRFTFVFLCLLLSPIFLPGCTPPPQEPTLSVQLSPVEVFPGGDLKLTVNVNNFLLAPNKIGAAVSAGEGHYRVYLDDKDGEDALLVSGEKSPTISLPKDISVGSHNLRVVLFGNDQKKLTPEVSVTREFTVLATGSPSIEASSEEDTVAIGKSIVVKVKVQNFRLKKVTPNPVNKDNEGHYHVYLDDKTGSDYLAAGYRGEVDVAIPLDVSPGKHKLRVVLMNNNHTPVSPSAFAEVEITVEGTDGPAVSVKVPSMYYSVSPGTEITMEVSVQKFALVKDKIGKANKEGEGHYRVYLDDSNGDIFLVADAAGTVKVTVPANTSEGEHKLIVSLRNNDGSALTPKREAVFKFSVKKASGPPTVKLTLNDSNVTTDQDVVLKINTTNFVLDPANIGKTNRPGYGHYRLYLDDKKGDEFLAVGATESLTVRIPANLSEGSHTLRVSLRNNDKSSLDPVAEDKITIQVSKGKPTLKVSISPTVVFAGGAIRVQVDARNFLLDATQMGKANKVGVGHYRIYLDNNTSKNFLYEGASETTTVTIPKGTNPGSHFLRISPRSNDKTANSLVAEVKIDFRVTEDAIPKVMITSQQSKIEAGKKLKVQITTQNFILDESSRGKANQLGTGHYNLYLGTNKGLNYLVTSTSASVEVLIPASTNPGDQILRVQLQQNDGTPFSPLVEATLQIEVTATTQPIVSASINKSTLKPGDSFELKITTKNFVLSKAMGTANKPGVGHYHVYLDNNTGANYLSAGADNSIKVILPVSTTPGMHLLRVRLMNNDHTPVTPTREAIIRIMVSN